MNLSVGFAWAAPRPRATPNKCVCTNIATDCVTMLSSIPFLRPPRLPERSASLFTSSVCLLPPHAFPSSNLQPGVQDRISWRVSVEHLTNWRFSRTLVLYILNGWHFFNIHKYFLNVWCLLPGVEENLKYFTILSSFHEIYQRHLKICYNLK